MFAVTMPQPSFAPFQLDVPAGRLFRGAQPVELRPKALAVLKYLVRRTGQLVTKDEIMRAVWPDVHVEDSVLKVTIGEIRKALGDTTRKPRFIETAHRLGYRFIGSIGQARTPVAPTTTGIPETRYARSGDCSIAYQVLGDGPIDLVFVMGWVSHLEYFWTEPKFASFLRRIASFSRLILFDKRGTGLSDRVPLADLPSLEQRMDDVRAVMDAAQSKRAVLCGISEGAAMSALFAATYPEKTEALIMFGPYAKRIRGNGYPWGPTESEREQFLKQIEAEWGGPIGLEERAPSLAGDPDFREWWATYLRMSASPAAAVALTRMNSQADIRNILPNISVPTLVLHRKGDRCLLAEEGRYVANCIPGAKFVELEGTDHLPFVGDQDPVLDRMHHFLVGLGGSRPRSEGTLATIVSADFEASRGEASHLGRRLQKQVSCEVLRFQGRRFQAGRNRMLAGFDGSGRAVRCAFAIAGHASRLGVQARFGLHIGEYSADRSTLCGSAVSLARQIEKRADPGELLVSATIRDVIASSEFQFADRGVMPSPDVESGVMQLLSVQKTSDRFEPNDLNRRAPRMV